VNSTGTYDFAGSVDLGAVYTSRLTATLAVQTVNYSNTWDTLSGAWDALDGTWDSLTPAKNVGAALELRTTNDDPGASPTWSAWRQFVVGDHTARAFQFRAILTSASSDASPGVSELAVEVDMPDRVADGTGLTLTGAALSVSFAPAFKASPRVGVTVKDEASGDRWEITNVSPSGFEISVYSSGGARVARTFDYLAKGYGVAA
jgi:1-aminocyclopropane-1-carboxylate deaminase/D-cysteine desulfhydrase-like pyridoxal-dependent ACC family enzyme